MLNSNKGKMRLCIVLLLQVMNIRNSCSEHFYSPVSNDINQDTTHHNGYVYPKPLTPLTYLPPQSSTTGYFYPKPQYTFNYPQQTTEATTTSADLYPSTQQTQQTQTTTTTTLASTIFPGYKYNTPKHKLEYPKQQSKQNSTLGYFYNKPSIVLEYPSKTTSQPVSTLYSTQSTPSTKDYTTTKSEFTTKQAITYSTTEKSRTTQISSTSDTYPKSTTRFYYSTESTTPPVMGYYYPKPSPVNGYEYPKPDNQLKLPQKPTGGYYYPKPHHKFELPAQSTTLLNPTTSTYSSYSTSEHTNAKGTTLSTTREYSTISPTTESFYYIYPTPHDKLQYPNKNSTKPNISYLPPASGYIYPTPINKLKYPTHKPLTPNHVSSLSIYSTTQPSVTNYSNYTTSLKRYRQEAISHQTYEAENETNNNINPTKLNVSTTPQKQYLPPA